MQREAFRPGETLAPIPSTEPPSTKIFQPGPPAAASPPTASASTKQEHSVSRHSSGRGSRTRRKTSIDTYLSQQNQDQQQQQEQQQDQQEQQLGIEWGLDGGGGSEVATSSSRGTTATPSIAGFGAARQPRHVPAGPRAGTTEATHYTFDWGTREPTTTSRSSRRSRWYQFKECFRVLVAWVFSNVGICVLVVGYLLMGAFTFEALEAPAERTVRFHMGLVRNQTVLQMWRITERLNTLHPEDWAAGVEGLLAQYQASVIKEFHLGYDGSDIPNFKWTFSGSLLYSITVITTIGYGHIVPATQMGKLATIVYTIFGVPLFLLYLSNIGNIMASSFKWTYFHLCKCQNRRNRRQQAISALSAVAEAPVLVGVLKRSQRGQPVDPGHPHQAGGRDLAEDDRVPPDDPIRPAATVPVGNHFSEGQFRQLQQQQQRQLELAETISVYSLTPAAGTDTRSQGFQGTPGPGTPRHLRAATVGSGASGSRAGIVRPPKSYSASRVTVPISLCLTVMVMYIGGGAILFGQWEGWGLLDGSYFCFITLSTIGFGDMVPGDSLFLPEDDDGGGGSSHPGRGGGPRALFNSKFILCSMYILVGMAVIAMCFNLMQEKVVQGVRSFGRRIGIFKDDDNG